jgi:hypothetical protein
MLQKLIPVIFFTIFSTYLFAQSGAIKGNIKDAKTGEAIIGASVLIEGTAIGAATDVEGNFNIPKAPAGVHTVVVSYISYQTKKLGGIRVEADKTTLINTTLEEDAGIALQEVVITAERATNTEVAVITEIKQAEQIATGISAQTISRSQDRDAAQVVRRVPGISINDDRFVMVRGLNERYNTVMLNDVITPSTEIDVKSFSFDLIPSSAIDRMLVYKTGAGELPGEFAGGVIKIYTKTIPDNNGISLGISSSYRQNTTFQDVIRYKGGKYDWAGFGNEGRVLPTGFPSRDQIRQGTRTEPVISAFRNLPDYFNLSNFNATPDFRASLGLTRRFAIGNMEMTNISYLGYTNTRSFANIDQARYLAFDPQAQQSDIQFIYKDKSFVENVRIGAMSNFGLILNPSNKIEFQNLFNQMGIKETVLRGGEDRESGSAGEEIQDYAFRYENRSIYSGQLNGTHNLTDLLNIKWAGGFAYTNRKEPDYRRFESSRSLSNIESPFQVDLPQSENSPVVTTGARFYSNLNEYVVTGSGNVERKLNLRVDTTGGDKNQMKLRAGFYVERKVRDFNARWFGLVNPNGSSAVTLSPEAFFNTANIAANEVFYNEGTNLDDKYDAQNLLTAGYVGAYIPFSSKINASIGFRAEYNRQELQSQRRGSGAPVNVNNPIFRPLPSVNIAYNFSEKTLFRLAYSLTLNRPEFRELAPFSYYDFNLGFSFTGNPELQTAQIHNLDARFEWYPSPSEVVSIAGFYKHFKDPIETVIRFAGSGLNYTFGNAEQSTSIGAELEVRKSLQELSNVKAIQNLSFLLNASVIYSDVTLGKEFAGQVQDRPMQGQSPYLINTGIYYSDPDHNWQANILYNVVGPRIWAVSYVGKGSVYEMPRNVIDLNIIKGFGEHFEVRAGIQDLLNQPFRLIQDSDENNKINDIDENYRRFRRGTYYTLGVNYTF